MLFPPLLPAERRNSYYTHTHYTAQLVYGLFSYFHVVGLLF